MDSRAYPQIFNMSSQNHDSEIAARLALHKLCVEMVNHVNQRKENANKFFLTLATAPVAILVLASRINAEFAPSPTVLLITGIAGIAIAAIWFLNLITYTKLNIAKFKVIFEIEEHLPFPVFTKEWSYLEPVRYPRFTRAETSVPLIILLTYIVPIAYAITKWVCP